MADTRDLLGSYLGCLQKGEAPQVARWLKMHYRGRRTHAVVLFELWWKQKAVFRDTEKAWEQLFPERPFNNRAWHQIRHRLAEAIKSWLAWCQLEEEPWDVNFLAGLQLVKARNHTDILWHYESQLSTSKQVSSEQRYKMEALFQLGHAYQNSVRPQPAAYINSFEDFAVEEKLMLLLIAKHDRQLQDRTMTDMDEFAVKLGATSSIPQIQLMSVLLGLDNADPLTGPSVIDLHKLHREVWQRIPRDRNASILQIILQRAYGCFNETGNLQHLRDYHEVVDWGISQRMFPEQRSIGTNTFKRLVQQSLALGRTDKARKYMRSMGPLLADEIQKLDLPLLEAFILLTEEQYAPAFGIAREGSNEKSYWRREVDMLFVELICRFELKKNEPEYLAGRLETVIRRLRAFKPDRQGFRFVSLYIFLAQGLDRLFKQKAARDTELLEKNTLNPVAFYLRKKWA